MKNKIFSFSAADLNTNNVSGVVAMISNVETTGAGRSSTWGEFPTRVKFINRSGVDIKVNFANNATDLSGIIASPSDYPMFTIVGAASAVTYETWDKSDSLPSVYGVVVQNPSGTAASTFDVECINYQRLF